MMRLPELAKAWEASSFFFQSFVCADRTILQKFRSRGRSSRIGPGNADPPSSNRYVQVLSFSMIKRRFRLRLPFQQPMIELQDLLASWISDSQGLSNSGQG